MSKVYTKTGDKGVTSLLGGARVSKSNELVRLYGSVDELNAFVGLSAVYALDHTILLQKIQSSLFDLGALLACPRDKRSDFGLTGIKDSLISELENEIDNMTANLDELKSFILPGGDVSAANIHLARTVTRRVERDLVESFNSSADAELESAIVFLNRLSDFFFVLARFYNKKNGVQDIPWKP